MINRNYLPYKSAREYIDKGMAKWMGFFISEHSTSLSKKKENSFFPDTDTEEETFPSPNNTTEDSPK